MSTVEANGASLAGVAEHVSLHLTLAKAVDD